MLRLQNAAFLPLFRGETERDGQHGAVDLITLEPEPPNATGPEALQEIFADVGRDRLAATRKALHYLSTGGAAQAFINMARQLIVFKGSNAHDYKFSGAVFEDCFNLTVPHRHRFLAASLSLLRGSSERDNGMAERTHTATGT